uniref:Uncharacterized protein n=1 Tax=Amphimedon queenslandica TaxID=400682 RepID=A0A1X7UDU4_AMPQE
MKAQEFAVELFIKEVKIANELNDIVADECQALLDCYGLTSIDDEESSLSDTSKSGYHDHLISNTEEVCSLTQVDSMPNDDILMRTLVDSKYNWSHRAFNAVACDMAQDDRVVRSINEEVVTDSESGLDECTATKDA